jgi:hypothetical protein
MKRVRKVSITILLAVVAFFMLTAESCDNQPQISLSGAEQVTSIYKVPKNSKGRTVEQQNIDDRIRVTTDPAKVMWIHLITLDGKIIRRMPVRCKVTSSGKRLEPTHIAPSYQNNFANIPGTIFETDELLQADGTYGHSDPYIYWFDPMGRYHQYGTAGGIGYLLTDYPIDLANPMDEITGMYNMNKAAYEWQQQQEALLREQEGK